MRFHAKRRTKEVEEHQSQDHPEDQAHLALLEPLGRQDHSLTFNHFLTRFSLLEIRDQHQTHSHSCKPKSALLGLVVRRVIKKAFQEMQHF